LLLHLDPYMTGSYIGTLPGNGSIFGAKILKIGDVSPFFALRLRTTFATYSVLNLSTIKALPPRTASGNHTNCAGIMKRKAEVAVGSSKANKKKSKPCKHPQSLFRDLPLTRLFQL
jgi:hypothetical protein